MKTATTFELQEPLSVSGFQAFPGNDHARIEPVARIMCRCISGKNQKNDLLWAIERVHELSEKKGEILVSDQSILEMRES